MTDEQEEKHTPKIQQAVQHLLEMRAKDPNHKGIIHSNYLAGGLFPASRALTKAGVPHAIFHGGVSKPERAEMVANYNSGKTPVLLLSSSGSEGLDLKGTKSISILEPHWNRSKTEQVIGRGIRYKSHAHLPENERKVRVMEYYSSPPQSLATRLGLAKPTHGIERYMRQSADRKADLGNQIMGAMQEASDAGPLKPPAAPKAASWYY